MRTQEKWIIALLLAFSTGVPSLGLAQDQNQQSPEPPSTGWRKFGGTNTGAAGMAGVAGTAGNAGVAGTAGVAGVPNPADPLPPSATLTLPAGSWITVRIGQALSSDRNQPGDAFMATLAQPLIANGRIIARRGQMVSGVVAETQKAGHVSGTSRLRIQLTEISLVDGRQIPVHTTLVERRGDTSVGRDAAAIGVTTGVGAAIGAGAAGGIGAAIGAGAGAVASTIGVLVTRGHPTIVYPESVLTFKLEAPVIISAEGTEDAFQPVTQQDYDQRYQQQPGAQWGAAPSGPPAGYGPPAYYAPSPYYGGYYPPYYYGYGPGLYFYGGPGFFYGRGFYGGRFYGGGFRGGGFRGGHR
jgi:hypothetical protein